MSRRTSGLVVALLFLATACGVNGLSFKNDERVDIVAPKDRAEVQFPVAIRWTVKDFSVTGPNERSDPNSGYFGVFVDREPQPPGETFRYLSRNDATCKITPGCPSTGYFESLGAYVTTKTSFVITSLPERRPESERRFRDFHEVNVVLLDGRGERIGESAFRVEFQLRRES